MAASLTEADIFKMSRFIMSWSGNDPAYYGWKFKLNATMMVFTSVVFTYLVAKTLMQIGEELDVLATSIISLTVYYQFISKMVLLLYYKKPLADAISEFENVWSLSLLDDDVEEKQEIQGRLKLYRMAIRIFVVVSSLQIVGFVGIPIVTAGRNLPYAFWLPHEAASPYYEIVFLLEVYALYILLSTVIGADSLFIAFCGSLAAQFKLLAHKFRRMEDGEGFKECIGYHQYLLRCFKKVEGIYQFTLFSQYALIVITICMNLYILSESDDAFAKINGIMYLGAIMMELNIYCIMSEIVETESAKLTFSIYESNWYETHEKTKLQNVHIAMMAVRKPLMFYIVGIVPLNMECYVVMLKAAFSYYTVLVQMKS